jgi:serine/threonine protein kinase/Tol biopolymer transport system component
MIGQTISHYRIIEKLGEGGMGIVYKAEDTKLKRIVALKFLPKGLEAHEPERARFLQEAQAASALNHPNISTIHDIQDQGGQQFIIMEYVDGETLKTSIVNHHLSFDNCLSYALQIGEALQEAHSHGIVHRDIKPENIMVNKKNQIKVMDFGLAKLKGSLKLTKTSSTVGTLAYMAPEQIQGGDVDSRSDIFSFGIVLFEMLTGRLPFRGEHEAAMMYSIVNEEPEPVEKYLPEVSPIFSNIIQRALEKDLNNRYQTAGDMVIELRRLQKKTSRVTRGLTAGMPTAAPVQAVPEIVTPELIVNKKSYSKIVWTGIGVISLFAIIALVYIFIPKQASQVTLNPDMTFRVLPILFNQVQCPGLSRDGNWAAFPAADANSRWDIYFMNTTSGESRRITSDSAGWINGADISPDGSQIVYDRYNNLTNQMEIAIVSSVGGSSKKIAEGATTGVFFPRWRPDGQRIGYVCGTLYSQGGMKEFWTVKPNGSDSRCELVDSTSGEAKRFSWSPDGQSICWIKYFSEQWREVSVYELLTKEERQVTFEKKYIRDVYWTSNDQIIFASNKSGNSNLWMVSALGGAVTQITKGTGSDYAAIMSRDGSKLMYLQSQSISHIWIAGINGGEPRQITFDDAEIWHVSFTPDAKAVLFIFSHPDAFRGGASLCSIDRDGRNRKQLTSGEELIEWCDPSPDGRWILYQRHALDEPGDSARVYLIDAGNPVSPKLVGKGWIGNWVNEKTFLIDDLSAPSTWLCSIDGGKPSKFFEDSTYACPLQGGKYIGYYDWRHGREGKWVCAAPGMKDPKLRTPVKLTSSIASSGFNRDGKFFYYVKTAGELHRISIPPGNEEVIRGSFPGLGTTPFSTFEISYDGKEIVYTDARINGRLVMIENPFK